LTQPWATLMAVGAKRIETRSWQTRYRGNLAIHAAKGFPVWAQDECTTNVFCRALWPDLTPGKDWQEIRHRILTLPRGAIVAYGYLAAIKPTTEITSIGISGQEEAFGDYSPGRFGWYFSAVRALPEPIECRGALSLWEVSADVEARISEQLKASCERAEQSGG
jgi:hypothetical protein